MAAAHVMRWRTPAALVALIVLGWLVYQTVHAGSDIPARQTNQQTMLSGGSANDKRLDGKSWSLDYDSATLSNDGSQAEIDRVHDGVIFRNGKPYMHMSAHHVSANLATNDFVVTGEVKFVEITGEHRRLETDYARYIGNEHLLMLDHPVTIEAAGMRFRVAKATVNFTTGDTKLGRIEGSL